MLREPIEFLSAVLVVSPNPARLAAFYRDVIGIALREEQHGGSRAHWGCNLPDGNFVEFTQLRDEWFTGIDARRTAGDDVVARWRVSRAAR